MVSPQREGRRPFSVRLTKRVENLDGLDGSSPSVLAQDLNGLVDRHGDGELQQQAGGDCVAEGNRRTGAM